MKRVREPLVGNSQRRFSYASEKFGEEKETEYSLHSFYGNVPSIAQTREGCLRVRRTLRIGYSSHRREPLLPLAKIRACRA